MKSLLEYLGWVGSILIILAYASSQLNYITQENIIYIGMNLIGAVCIAINLFPKKVYGPFMLNVFWATIALFALYKNLSL